MNRAPLLLLLLLGLAGCLAPWPIGQPSPGFPVDDDDGADDDDTSDDDDDTSDDDDISDDDDDTSDDDDDDTSDDDDDTIFNPKDQDGDGWDFNLDCDDSNPDVNPDATEIACDGIDNDCDTLLPCQPCAQGTPIESGSVGVGLHDFVGSLAEGDEIYGQNGLYRFDIYRFVAGTSGLYTFDLASSEFNAYLEMYNASCEYGGSNDDGGDGTNANLGLFLFEGDIFHIVTTSANELESGGYSMALLVL